jgi:hypothetical protein
MQLDDRGRPELHAEHPSLGDWVFYSNGEFSIQTKLLTCEMRQLLNHLAAVDLSAAML